MLEKRIESYYRELQENIKQLDQNKILKICRFLRKKILDKRKIFVCGNGGSAAISAHFETDLNQNLKRRNKRLKARVISLSNSSSMITAIANDVSFEKVFERQLDNLYDKNDCLVIFSCSGTSKNIVNICKFAKQKKLDVISIVGCNNQSIKKYCKHHVSIKSKNYGVLEDIFQSIMHVILEI